MYLGQCPGLKLTICLHTDVLDSLFMKLEDSGASERDFKALRFLRLPHPRTSEYLVHFAVQDWVYRLVGHRRPESVFALGSIREIKHPRAAQCLNTESKVMVRPRR